MEKAGQNRFRHSELNRLSSRVLVLLIAVIALMFGSFWSVGYEMPFDENPVFNAPLLTDVLLWFVYALVAVTLILVLVSVAYGFKTRSDDSGRTNGVPAARIFYLSLALPVVCMVVTFALSSDEPLTVNGQQYTSAIWLRLTDMFINTSLILIAVAVAAVAYGLLGLNLRHRGRKSN